MQGDKCPPLGLLGLCSSLGERLDLQSSFSFSLIFFVYKIAQSSTHLELALIHDLTGVGHYILPLPTSDALLELAQLD